MFLQMVGEYGPGKFVRKQISEVKNIRYRIKNMVFACFHPFPKGHVFYSSKLKEFADDNFKCHVIAKEFSSG